MFHRVLLLPVVALSLVSSSLGTEGEHDDIRNTVTVIPSLSFLSVADSTHSALSTSQEPQLLGHFVVSTSRRLSSLTTLSRGWAPDGTWNNQQAGNLDYAAWGDQSGGSSPSPAPASGSPGNSKSVQAGKSSTDGGGGGPSDTLIIVLVAVGLGGLIVMCCGGVCFMKVLGAEADPTKVMPLEKVTSWEADRKLCHKESTGNSHPPQHDNPHVPAISLAQSAQHYGNSGSQQRDHAAGGHGHTAGHAAGNGHDHSGHQPRHSPRPDGAAHSPRPTGTAHSPRPNGTAHSPRPNGSKHSAGPLRLPKDDGAPKKSPRELSGGPREAGAVKLSPRDALGQSGPIVVSSEHSKTHSHVEPHGHHGQNKLSLPGRPTADGHAHHSPRGSPRTAAAGHGGHGASHADGHAHHSPRPSPRTGSKQSAAHSPRPP